MRGWIGPNAASDRGRAASGLAKTTGTARRPRVCVVDSPSWGIAYERLDECDLDVMAVLPGLTEAEFPLLGGFDVVILGCTESMLMSPVFQRRVAHVTRITRLVGVGSDPGPNALARAARIGFHGFVARDVGPRAFERAIWAVLNGEIAFPRSASTEFVRLVRRRRVTAVANETAVLTAREQQVIDLIATGANDREIADRLRISPSTVHKHVQKALRRTQTKTRSQLAAWLAVGGHGFAAGTRGERAR